MRWSDTAEAVGATFTGAGVGVSGAGVDTAGVGTALGALQPVKIEMSIMKSKKR
jgi:hypothetical protein